MKTIIILASFLIGCFLSGCSELEERYIPESPLPAEENADSYTVYQGASTYGDEFVVNYSNETWEYIFENTNRKLKHQAIAGCELWLNEGAVGRSEEPTIIEIEAGNYTWTRGIFSTERRAVYSTPVNNKYYLFGVTYAEPATEAELEQCLADAEEVIATFEPVE